MEKDSKENKESKESKESKETKKKKSTSNQRVACPTYNFALVVVRHPADGKFLLVNETSDRGWWLPGGGVELGESFQAAAIRETLEEGGIRINLKGILRIERKPMGQFARMRVIFYAEPVESKPKIKTVPDEHSIESRWVTSDEVQTGKIGKIRGAEPLEWFNYVNQGGIIYPLTLWTLEGSPAPNGDQIKKDKEYLFKQK
eukprot:TRINITY_DN3134_c0_g2_i1.p1 TRINITY_DN3134_c0_g2~~TRINITY_DN3134_c0_g2_i1.p1  ORF type:complete len:201 (-),score=39.67 TRINITY_DN3134_c0_g2_i1:104-706(-)